LATNDSVLLERAREYDAQALAEIYDCYAESIYRYLYRYLGNAHRSIAICTGTLAMPTWPRI